jgi:hypothetical protein
LKIIGRAGLLGVLGAVALGTALIGTASAQQPSSTTYTASLAPVPLNGADGASGTLTIQLVGNQATITEKVSGLAETFMNAPFPHVQHIHGGANGACPTASADTNGDGVLSTVEGGPSYGDILTTLSVSGDTTPAAGTNVQTAPSGSSIDYSRTITLDDATMASLSAGNAVIVVHGLDPATAAAAAASSPSELVPSLPLAATSPALCGVVKASSNSTGQTGSSTMRPPSTGDAGLKADGGSETATFAGIGLVALILGSTALVVARGRSH